MHYACKGEHTLFTSQRERVRKREREKDTERKTEREKDIERKREREKERVFIFKRNDGCLETF